MMEELSSVCQKASNSRITVSHLCQEPTVKTGGYLNNHNGQ